MLSYIKTVPVILGREGKDWQFQKTSSRLQGNGASEGEKTGQGQRAIGQTSQFGREKVSQLKCSTNAGDFAPKQAVRASVHQTKNSAKPTVPYSYRNKENNALGQIRTIGIKQRPNRIPKSQRESSAQQMKQLPRQDIKSCAVQVLREDQKNNDSQMELHSLMQRSYELKMVQFEEENEKYPEMIADLRAKVETHEQEKQCMQQRINTIEKELVCLQVHYDQILMEHQKGQTVEEQVQTQNQTVEYGQRSTRGDECFNSHNGSQICELCAVDGEDWFSRARYYKCLLQQERVQSANREKEWKLQSSNGEIEWRRKLQTLQRQFNNLREKYEGKCQEVREKEELISRYVLHRK